MICQSIAQENSSVAALQFDSLDTKLCINISDLVAVPVETFSVVLSSNDPGVDVSLDLALINIVADNKSKSLFFLSFPIMLLSCRCCCGF